MKRQILLTIGVITTVFMLSLGITISGVKYLELERDYQRLKDSLASGLFFGSKISASATETVTPSHIQSVVKAYNHRITESQSLQIAYSLDSWIVARNLSLRTSLAIVAHESRFDPDALGGAGDKGLWQLNEKALKELERRYEVSINRSRLLKLIIIVAGEHFILDCVLFWQMGIEKRLSPDIIILLSGGKQTVM